MARSNSIRLNSQENLKFGNAAENNHYFSEPNTRPTAFIDRRETYSKKMFHNIALKYWWYSIFFMIFVCQVIIIGEIATPRWIIQGNEPQK